MVSPILFVDGDGVERTDRGEAGQGGLSGADGDNILEGRWW